MDPILLSGMLGGLGGATRGLVGLLKSLALKRKIIWQYWMITVVISIIIGVFTGIIFDFDPR